MGRREPRSFCTGNSSTSTSGELSTSTSLSTTQIKEIASQLSRHPRIHKFFSNHVQEVFPNREAAGERFSFRCGERVALFECNKGSLKELGEVVAAAHEEALAQGCREAVALALCALPCGNHFTELRVVVPRNSGSAPFLALMADSSRPEGLRFGVFLAQDWFRREADWSLLAHLILHNTTLKTLQLDAGLQEMSEKGGIALADSIRNNRGLQALNIEHTDAFGKEGGGLALAAMVRHNSTLRKLRLRNVPLCSRGAESLAKAVGASRGLRELEFTIEGNGPVPFGRAIAQLSDCVLENLFLCVHPEAADAMIKLLTTSNPGHAGVRLALPHAPIFATPSKS